MTRASLWIAGGIALLLTGVGVGFAGPLAGLFRLEPETVALAEVFIRWISVFNLSFSVAFVLGTALRAAGDVITPLLLAAITNGVNVVMGAAVASGSAFTLGAALTVLLWLRGRLLIRWGPPRALKRERVRRLLAIGYPAALEQGVWQGGFIVFLWIVSFYGTAPYAAYGIGVSILAFSFVVGFAFSIAASTLVGQHLGAGDPDGAAAAGWRAMRIAVGVMLGMATLIVAFAEPLARLMIDDAEVVRLTVVFIYVLGSVQALMAVEFALSGALRGAGDTRFPLWTVLSGLFGVRIALAGLFTWRGLTVEWIFAALIFDYITKAAMLSWRFRSGSWKSALA